MVTVLSIWHTDRVPAIRTARERARCELIEEIKANARRQLAAVGAAQLSLRAVARSLGMAPSALYRYFPSREDLLTALLVDAYNSLGDQAEAAAARPPAVEHGLRWIAACRAMRDWAQQHPHEYSLIYGSVVPGYQAPPDTIAPAARVPLLLLTTVRDAWQAGQIVEPAAVAALPESTETNAAVLAAATGLDDVPAGVLLRAVTAYTQLFGAISLELFGHLRGAFDDDAVFFAHSIDLLAGLIGFTGESPTGGDVR